MGADEHKAKAADGRPARCAILSVTDTKTLETDSSGLKAAELLQGAGHEVGLRAIVANDRAAITDAASKASRAYDLIVTIGGTGASKKDGTVEALRPLLDKELPGFGETFRTLSAKEIGTAAMLSRALLGTTTGGALVVCLPGSEAAVRLGIQDVLLPELKHLLWELRRYA